MVLIVLPFSSNLVGDKCATCGLDAISWSAGRNSFKVCFPCLLHAAKICRGCDKLVYCAAQNLDGIDECPITMNVDLHTPMCAECHKCRDCSNMTIDTEKCDTCHGAPCADPSNRDRIYMFDHKLANWRLIRERVECVICGRNSYLHASQIPAFMRMRRCDVCDPSTTCNKYLFENGGWRLKRLWRIIRNGRRWTVNHLYKHQPCACGANCSACL